MSQNIEVGIEIPTYYGVNLSFYEFEDAYYMQSSEWDSIRIAISKEFFEAVVREFSNKELSWTSL